MQELSDYLIDQIELASLPNIFKVRKIKCYMCVSFINLLSPEKREKILRKVDFQKIENDIEIFYFIWKQCFASYWAASRSNSIKTNK